MEQYLSIKTVFLELVRIRKFHDEDHDRVMETNFNKGGLFLYIHILLKTQKLILSNLYIPLIGVRSGDSRREHPLGL